MPFRFSSGTTSHPKQERGSDGGSPPLPPRKGVETVQQPPAVPDRKFKPVIEESRGTGRGLEIDLIDLHITDQEMRQGQILRDFDPLEQPK